MNWNRSATISSRIILNSMSINCVFKRVDNRVSGVMPYKNMLFNYILKTKLNKINVVDAPICFFIFDTIQISELKSSWYEELFSLLTKNQHNKPKNYSYYKFFHLLMIFPNNRNQKLLVVVDIITIIMLPF